MTRYRLPASLGGVEAESAIVVRGDVGFDFDDVQGRVWLPLSSLTEVKPPLPPEPPEKAVVYVDGRAAQRYGEKWFVPGGSGALTWAELCDLGTPVPLVAYEPVDLPWKGDSGLAVALSPSPGAALISFGARGTTWAIHSIDDLRGAARALWTAADLQEGKQS